MMPSMAGTVDALGFLAVQLEHLLEALHVVLGLAQVGAEALLELRVAGFLDHFGQRLQIWFSA